MKWELLRPGGNSPVTIFAGDDELFAFLHHEPQGRIVMTEIIVQAARQQVRRACGLRVNMGLKLSLKARTAQNRRATGRLKRNRCGRSTFGTIRLSFDAYPYLGASLTLNLASIAAFSVVFELFFTEEKLLSSRENELGVAINALQNPVRI